MESSFCTGEKNMKLRYVIASLGAALVLSSCGQTPVVEATLDSISLSGTYQTEYLVGEAYNSTGLVVTAHYSDETTAHVADYTVSGFDSSSVGEKTVTVTYQEKTASYTVNVSPIDPTHLDITVNVTVSGIESYAKNHSHIYMYQKFSSTEWSFTPMSNTNGHLWTASFKEVKVGKSYEYNFYYGDENLPDLVNGKNVITGSSRSITVNKSTTTYALTAAFNVVEPAVVTLDSISLEGGYKTTYKVGETLDLTGLVVVAHYSDDSTKIIKNYSNSGFSSTEKGTCEVIISYTEGEVTKTAGFTATITNPLKSIAIKTKPNKLVYEYGEEFSKTGLQVTATYDDNTTKDVTSFEVSGYDKTVIGEQTITVSYEEDEIVKTASFTVKVNNSVVSIEVVHLPDKLEYLPTEKFNSTGLVVIATLKNGTKVYLDDEDYTLTGTETTTAGEKTVTVKYKDNEEITDTFKFNVKQPDTSDVKSVDITTKPTKLSYYLGEELDLSGMVITVTYVNDESEVIDAGYIVSGFDSESLGTKTITISYGKTASFEVEVKKCYQNITLAITVSGLTEYKDSYSKIYIEHDFKSEDENDPWVTEVMTQDQTNKNLWTISFNNIETEKYYHYNCYFGDDEAADKVYGKNILDDESQSIQVVRGTTEYAGTATFQISEVEKEFDLVLKPKVKTSSTAEEVDLADEVYMYVWDSQSDSKSEFTLKNDGFYHKQFTVTLVNGKGELSYNAGLSNYEDMPEAEWKYTMGQYDGTEFKPYETGYKLTISPNTAATVEQNVLFNGQPSFDTYELQVTVNITGDVSGIDNIKFIANNDDTETYDWNIYTVDDVKATNVMSIKDLDLSKPLYYKIYVYNTDTSEYRVGGTGGVNFSLVPYKALEKVEVDFTVGETEGTSKITGRSKAIMSFDDQLITVYGTPVALTPTFTDSQQHTFTVDYKGTDIRIDTVDGVKKIVGLKAGTTTLVNLVADTGYRCSFAVRVTGSEYEATAHRDQQWPDGGSAAAPIVEHWFDSDDVAAIPNITSDFMNGIDISSVKALYDNGTKFYNTDGVQQSLFYILKENGVNWVRMKLWVNPYTNEETPVAYGGGINDLETDLWIAKEAKAAGLKVLLDFHYSDFWTDPATQIIPKAWKDASTAEEMAGLIQAYTTETLTRFKNAGCLPEMVQLGNEISSGMLMKTPGTGTSFNAYGEPSYKTGASNADESIQGKGGSTASDNMKKYINAGATGVDAVDSSIKKIVHWAKGGSGISGNVISTFFNSLTNVNYDYAAISFYPFYCFDTMDDAGTILSGINIDKPWLIAETSYPFTGKTYVYEDPISVTNFVYNGWNKDDAKFTDIYQHYNLDANGQAALYHDLTAKVVENGGLGIFYWEGAWVPNKDVGWAGAGSTCSWSNQGFFSYDGKALKNISIFNQMLGNN